MTRFHANVATDSRRTIAGDGRATPDCLIDAIPASLLPPHAVAGMCGSMVG